MPQNSFKYSEFFPLPLDVQLKNDGRCAILLGEFVYDDPTLMTSVHVPVGFASDFNSVPRGLWNLFPPWEYPEAAIVHDFLYRTPLGRSRAEIDKIHRRILEILGCPAWLRWTAWAALRVAGKKNYDSGIVAKACKDDV